MSFDAVALQHLEDALSEAFRFHDNLDAFLTRSGVSAIQLADIRRRAEARAAGSRFGKAPKRYIAQLVIQDLGAAGESGDRVLATMITGLTQMSFPDATDSGKEAIEALRAKRKSDSQVRAEERAEREREAAEAKRTQERQREAVRSAKTAQRDALRERFTGLMAETNAQSRGYLFETFLNDLFVFEGLDPSASFRLTGEQIDGAFAWRGRTYLVEAKWTQKLAAGLEFGAFLYKLDGKSADTRGLFVSVLGYSSEAMAGLNGKGTLNFVCVDGAHLMRALIGDEGLVPILERVSRHADETGQAYLPASQL